MRYPFFGKPVAGIRSIGVGAVERYDAGGDALVFMGGKTLGIDGFVKELEAYRKQGYLFQEMLRPHPEIAALCGARVSTVRLIVLIEHGEPAVFHALWKIPVGANPADNFWRPGNLLAGLDAAHGRVTRVIQGTGADQLELERHPDTEQPLVGAVLPDWTKVTELCLKAARCWSRSTSGAISICPRWPTPRAGWTSAFARSSTIAPAARADAPAERRNASRRHQLGNGRPWASSAAVWRCVSASRSKPSISSMNS
jgi:hypothetical protein